MLLANFSGCRVRHAATLTFAFSIMSVSDVRAQIATDNTTNTVVQTSNNVSDITGGIKSGSNLFHSFGEFSVETRATANFNHGAEIENIFSRVTGGVSKIDGLIQTQGDTNLFLLNPAGVIFEANAQLDIGGSFVVSTGDSLVFADGTEFSAVEPETESLLTVTAPVGLQYGNPGAIEVRSNKARISQNNTEGIGFAIYSETTLALLGGDVRVNGQKIDTVGGNTEISSVKSGQIAIARAKFGWQFDYRNAEDFGKIDFDNRAEIESSGKVNFQGRTISFSAGSGVVDFNQFGELKSTIELTATESVEMNRGLLITQVGEQRELIEGAITDVGGDIIINAPKINFSNGSIVSAGTLSDGAGGSITINASEELRLFAEDNKNPSIISTSTGGAGDGGQIELNIGRLSLEDGSQVQALGGLGSGGTITVNGAEEVFLSGTGILRSQNLTGDITETELASGFAASSGIESLPSEQQPGGESGSSIVNTPKLTIEQSAEISVSNYGSANAGDIDVNTDTLKLDTKGKIIANTASGEGGSIDILGNKLVILDRGSSISTTAAQNGNGGNITLKTDNLALLDFNRISADASLGNGGNISIDTQGLFVDRSSSITASSEVEQKQGNVAISTLDLDSRLAVDYVQQSALDSSKQITSGCGAGAGLNKNKFRDVGKGGIPQNPFREIAQIETLGDWSTDTPKVIKVPQSSQSESRDEPIIEAGSWIVNSQGIVELVAGRQKNAFTTPCHVHPS